MAKISFNAQALGITRYDDGPDMSHAVARSTFQPSVVCRPGIVAIIEGLRLANVEGFKVARDQPLAGDVDA